MKKSTIVRLCVYGAFSLMFFALITTFTVTFCEDMNYNHDLKEQVKANKMTKSQYKLLRDQKFGEIETKFFGSYYEEDEKDIDASFPTITICGLIGLLGMCVGIISGIIALFVKDRQRVYYTLGIVMGTVLICALEIGGLILYRWYLKG